MVFSLFILLSMWKSRFLSGFTDTFSTTVKLSRRLRNMSTSTPSMSPATSITVISSPYHLGARNKAVGAGPTALLNAGLMASLSRTGVPVHQVEIPPVDDFDGEIARLFELVRRTSTAVTKARTGGSFPLVLAGNCSATVGVAAGIVAWCGGGRGKKAPGCVWFDAHDDFNTPDALVSGYLDSMPVAMLEGQGWRALLGSVPGFVAMDLERDFVHVGMRDVTELERQRVLDKGFAVVWGDVSGGEKVDFVGGLADVLEGKKKKGDGEGGRLEEACVVHLDLDALDVSVGAANKFAAPGGLLEEDLEGCLGVVVRETRPVSLTVASYDPAFDEERGIPGVAVRAVVGFMDGLVSRGLLVREA